MLASIETGDTVVTAGGFFGRVCDVLDDSYIIELADGVWARILKSSVSSKRDSGEGKPKPRKMRKKKIASISSDEGISPEEDMALMGPAANDEDGQAKK
jgi:preprotein translocase subunit YajC